MTTTDTSTRLTVPARPLPHQELASGPMPAAVVDLGFLAPGEGTVTYVVPVSPLAPLPLAA